MQPNILEFLKKSQQSVKDFKVQKKGMFYSLFLFRPFLRVFFFIIFNFCSLPPSGFGQIFSYLEWRQLG